MSGGLAFVYDPDSRLAPLCNVDVAGDLFPVEDSQVLRALHCTALWGLGVCSSRAAQALCSWPVRV